MLGAPTARPTSATGVRMSTRPRDERTSPASTSPPASRIAAPTPSASAALIAFDQSVIAAPISAGAAVFSSTTGSIPARRNAIAVARLRCRLR